MKDYKVGGRGRSETPNILTGLLAALAGTGGVQAKPNADGTTNTNSMQAPSFWQTLLNPNLATGYQSGQFGLAQERERGSQERQTNAQLSQQNINFEKAKAALDLNKDFKDEAIKIADQMQVPIKDENDLVTFTAATFHPAVVNAAAQQGIQATQLGTSQATATAQNVMAKSPTGQDAAGQNYLAGLNEQSVRNQSMIPDTGPFGLRYGNLGPGQGTLSISGFQPGSASTEQSSFTIKNGMPVQTKTSTVTPTVGGGQGSIVPNLEQSDLDSIHNSFLQQQGANTNAASPPGNVSTGNVIAKPVAQSGFNPSNVAPVPQVDFNDPAQSTMLFQAMQNNPAMQQFLQTLTTAKQPKPANLQDILNYFGGPQQ